MKNLRNKLLTAFVLGSLPLFGMSPEVRTIPSFINEHFPFDQAPALDKDLMGQSYAGAPEEFHNLVHAFKTGLCIDAYTGPKLLMGPPGTGKTLFAQSLFYVLNEPFETILALEGLKEHEIEELCKLFKEKKIAFNYKYIGPDLGTHYQHSKACDLLEIIDFILKTEKYCVLHIDEVHALFSDLENKGSNQALETAVALKHSFERLKKSQKVVTILTTNYPEQIPLEYGLRSWFLQGNVFHFDQPDRQKQLIAMQYHLKKVPSVNVEISEESLKNFLNNTDGWSLRRLADLGDESVQNALIENSKNAVVQIKHVQEALNTLQENCRQIKFDHEELSEQERFCNETLEQQEEHHNAQLRHAQLSMECANNLHNSNMVTQLRSYITSLKKATHYPTGGIHYAYPNGGWDLSGVLAGDTKKVLPENIQSYVNNKKPVPSLYMQHREEIDSSIREERLRKEHEERDKKEKEERERKEREEERLRGQQPWQKKIPWWKGKFN